MELVGSKTSRILFRKAFRALGIFILVVAQNAGAWVEMKVENGIAYFLQDSPRQIARYDLSTTNWLSPLALVDVPSAFAVGTNHIYVGSGRKIERFDLDGTGLTHVGNTASDVRSLQLDGNLLIASRSSLWVTYDLVTLSNITEYSGSYTLVGASHSKAQNRIFGRSSGVSPSDIHYVEYNDDGSFSARRDSPYHGDYPGATQTWVFPDGSKVVDSSGTVYNTADLTYNNSFGGTIDDLAFYGGSLPVVLSGGGGRLTSYSNRMLSTGSQVLSNSGRRVWVQGDTVFVFRDSVSATAGIGIEVVPVSALTPDVPGASVSPEGLAYEITSSALATNGVLYLLSKSFNSIFPWDISNQTYLPTIPLSEPGELIVFSESLNRLYVYSPTRRIYRIELGSTNAEVVHHLNTPLNINKLLPLGTDLMTMRNGSWEDQWI